MCIKNIKYSAEKTCCVEKYEYYAETNSADKKTNYGAEKICNIHILYNRILKHLYTVFFIYVCIYVCTVL